MTDAYDPASRPCANGVTSGAKALQSAILAYWSHATNLGTFICRNNAGGAPSVHGNGRAGDIGRDLQLIIGIAEWLVANHTVLGVQLVIVNHKIWNVSIPGGWRAYGCDTPGSGLDHHDTHTHWEINKHAGATLTRAIIDSVQPHPPIPQPEPETDMLRIVQCREHPTAGEFLTNGVDVVRTLTPEALIHGRNLGYYPQTTDQVPHDWIVWVDQVQDNHHNPGGV